MTWLRFEAPRNEFVTNERKPSSILIDETAICQPIVFFVPTEKRRGTWLLP